MNAELTDRTVLVLSGISGSGKSVALTTLEDQGFYAIDNLPAGLVQAVVTQTLLAKGALHKLAIVIDARNRPEDLEQFPQALAALGAAGIAYRVVFLDSHDDVLIKRYSETRRRHPLSVDAHVFNTNPADAVDKSLSHLAPSAIDTNVSRGLSLREAIVRERRLLQPIVSLADLIIDTSELNVHQLRRKITTELGLRGVGLFILFESFAYRKGLPNDADFLFDARSLPNPHWDSRLRPLSGRDGPVKEWLENEPTAVEFRTDLIRFLERWLPTAETTERSYVTVAIGCTGGRHRSVYLVEALSAHFRETRGSVLSFHRELG